MEKSIKVWVSSIFGWFIIALSFGYLMFKNYLEMIAFVDFHRARILSISVIIPFTIGAVAIAYSLLHAIDLKYDIAKRISRYFSSKRYDTNSERK